MFSTYWPPSQRPQTMEVPPGLSHPFELQGVLVRNVVREEILLANYDNEREINITVEEHPQAPPVLYNLITIMTENKLLVARPKQSHKDQSAEKQYAFIREVIDSFFEPIEDNARVICRLYLPSEDGISAIGYPNQLRSWEWSMRPHLQETFPDSAVFDFQVAFYPAHRKTPWTGYPDPHTKITIQDAGTASRDPNVEFHLSNDVASAFPVTSVTPFGEANRSGRRQIQECDRFKDQMTTGELDASEYAAFLRDDI